MAKRRLARGSQDECSSSIWCVSARLARTPAFAERNTLARVDPQRREEVTPRYPK